VKISPKVYLPTLIAVVAGLLLWLITGDKTALIVCLTGLAGGGIGAAAPPAPGVKQRQVAELARPHSHVPRKR
jgi:hypothetical protein